jgi:hypothetical protein
LKRNQQRLSYSLVWTAPSLSEGYSDQLSLRGSVKISLLQRQLVVHHTLKLLKPKPICCLGSLMG